MLDITMSSDFDVAKTLDCKGESCPMPVVKSKSAVDDLTPGEVLEMISTDSGSISDISGWASGTDGVELLEQEEGDDLYVHYIRKTS